MSIRGVFQLSKLTVRYCDIQSGSRGVRDFLRNGATAFAAKNPHLDIHVEVQCGRHPIAIGEYRNGNVIEHGLRDATRPGVADALGELRDNTGRKVKRHPKDVVPDPEAVRARQTTHAEAKRAGRANSEPLYSDHSIQGMWDNRRYRVTVSEDEIAEQKE